MTIAEVRKRIRKIKEVYGDCEVAHIMEDKLMEDVVRMRSARAQFLHDIADFVQWLEEVKISVYDMKVDTFCYSCEIRVVSQADSGGLVFFLVSMDGGYYRVSRIGKSVLAVYPMDG